MNILLISINKDDDSETQLGLGYLKTYAEKHIPNINIKIITNPHKEDITLFSPDLVGISAVTRDYPQSIRIAKYCRKQQITTLIGGIHITLMPESLHKSFDYAILGEGERAFVKLIQSLKQNKPLKRIIIEPQIENLDELPFPDRSYFKIDKSAVRMFSSRGCPYNCAFCSSTKFWKTTRFHSAEYVVSEIEHIINTHKASHIVMSDDLFISERRRVYKIVRILKTKKLIGKVTFTVSCRANLVTPEIIDKLKEMNVTNISMGLESGSNKILKELKGELVSREINMRAINIIKNRGLICSGSFIIGSPNDTLQTIQETYDFINQSKLNDFSTFIMVPFPNTKIWDYAIENKLIKGNINFEEINVLNPNISMCKNLTIEELKIQLKRFKRLKLKKLIKNSVSRTMKEPKKTILSIKRKIT
jgi:anaerobic magnesium-protoporphyrin IX monomethyl ester cyclase